MRTSSWVVGCLCVAIWSEGVSSAPTYDVIEMNAAEAERRYIDLNDASQALSMRRVGFREEIAIEEWSNGGAAYSEVRPGLLPGATEMVAAAFNNAGHVVGSAYFAEPNGSVVGHAFVYRDGQFTDLHASLASGATSSAAIDITTDGTVLGRSGGRSFLYSQGTTTYLPFAADAEIFPAAVNDLNQIAGTFTPPTPPGTTPYSRLFLYDNGTFNDLGRTHFMPGPSIEVMGINNRSEIIGQERYSNHGSECFILGNGARKSIATAGCAILDINDAGIAVGRAAFDSSLRNRAFIHIDSGRIELKTLIDPGYLAHTNLDLVSAVAINNKNEIIAIGNTGSGTSNRYYLLVPRQPTSEDTAYYNFEQPNESWYNAGEPIASVGTSNVEKFAGASSLAVEFNGSGYVSIGAMYPPPLAGKTVTFHVYLPADATIEWVQPFVLEDYFGGWAWHGNWQPASNLKFGAWNTITLPIPANATAGYRIGVEFFTSQPYTGTVYIDSVGF